MSQFHSYDPATGHGLPHNPFKAIIAPRPIGWISSVGPDGVANLAPYSFFNAICEIPPILVFGSEGRKDSINNIEASGEFVFNLATRRQAEAMNQTSANYASDIDEFEAAGLGKVASEVVAPPRVAGTPAAMECKLLEIKPLIDINGKKLAREIVIGQVVRVHIDMAYIREGRFDTVGAGSIARCGYRGDYAEVTELFEMVRPVITS